MASDTTSSKGYGAGSATGTASSSTTSGGTSTPGTSAQGSATAGRRTDREELESQISKLREDVSGVAEALKGIATNRSHEARGQATAIKDEYKAKGERYLRQAQEAADDLEDQVSDRIRDEPIKSVLIAAAVGYLYARIFH